MSTLVYAFGTFFLAFSVHVVIWRVSVPRRQTEALLKIFFGTMTIAACFYAAVFKKFFFGIPAFGNTIGFLRFFILYSALTFAYVVSYSAIEADSPSLVILRRIHQAGRAGLPEDCLRQELNDNLLLMPRIDDLVRDGLIISSQGKYRLTSKGERFVGIFILFRRCLNAAKGG